MDINATPVGRNQTINFTHKVEFSYIENGDPQVWIRKCERYFHYNRVEASKEKLEMDILHLNVRVESWYFSFHLSKGRVR